MNLLLAQMTTNDAGAECWQRVMSVKPRVSDLRFSVPSKFQGQIEPEILRQAARFFSAESADRSIDYAIGSKKFRVTKF